MTKPLFWRSVLILALLLPTLAAPPRSTAAPAALEAGIHGTLFGPQQVISTATDGVESVYTADLDGDSDPDVLSASRYDNKIAWYENDGSGGFGPQQVISTAADGVESVYAADLDGDGDADVLSASRYDNKIAWYENDGSGAFGPQQVISTSANGALLVYVADLDGDGDPDVLSTSSFDNKIAWYENDGSGVFGPQQIITTADYAPNSVFAADLDGDGDLDVLSASQIDDKIAWYENDGSGGFGPQQVLSTTADGARSVYAADLDGDGDPDVLSASQIDDKIAWYENDGGGAFSAQQIISTAADGAISVYAADLDGDGDPDVLSASVIDDKIAWYENDGSGAFGPQQVLATTADGAISVYAADLDGDGDPDVLSASVYDDKIAWYENLLVHRSVCFKDSHAIYTNPPEQTFTLINAIDAGDLDGDGDPDLLMGSDYAPGLAWFTNDGSGGFSTPLTFTLALDKVRGVEIADLNADGALDVIANSDSDGKAFWYANDGSGGFGARQVFTASLNIPSSILAVDLDGNSKTDVVLVDSANDTIAWLQNQGNGMFSAALPVTNAVDFPDGANTVAAADLDGDGDPDLLSASQGDAKVAWYENDGAGSFAAQQVIATLGDGATSVAAGDLDGDGDPDVIATSKEDKIFWFANDGSAAFGPAQTAADMTDPYFAEPVDLDGDGDLDLLYGALFNSSSGWLENDGSGAFTLRIAFHPSQLTDGLAVDLNADGNPDPVMNEYNSGNLYWFDNLAGQFRFTPPQFGSGGYLDTGGLQMLMEFELTHLGRSGDQDGELASLALRFDEGAGDPLSSAEANALFEDLRLYLPDGNPYNLTDNTLVATLADLSLVDGVLTWVLTDDDPNLRLPFGTPLKLIVAAKLQLDALAQTPNTFLMTYLSEETRLQEASQNVRLAPACPQDFTSSPFMLSQTGVLIEQQSAPNPSIFGETVTLTTTLKGYPGAEINPSGQVVIYDEFNLSTTALFTGTLDANFQVVLQTSSLAVGIHNLYALYLGDSLHEPAYSYPIIKQAVLQSGSSASLAVEPSPSVFGQSVTLTATVSAAAPVVCDTTAGACDLSPSLITPDGTVEFYDGLTLLGSDTLDSNGQASLQTSSLAVGSHSLSVQYLGSASFSGDASDSVAHQVIEAVTSLSLTSSPNPSMLLQPVSLTAVISESAPGNPGGTIDFFDGASLLGSAPLIGGQASITVSSLALGSHNLTAQYAGDAVFLPSTSPVHTHTVGKIATQLLLSSSNDPGGPLQPVTFTAQVITSLPEGGVPNGWVSFYQDGALVGGGQLDSQGKFSLTLNFNKNGLYPITAVYAGNQVYAAADAFFLQHIGYWLKAYLPVVR